MGIRARFQRLELPLAAISGDKKEQSFEIFTLVFLEREKRKRR